MAGAVAVICVSLLRVKPAFVPPKETDDTLLNPEPVMTTLIPPPVGPLVGETDVTVGLATYVYWSAAEVVLVPFGVVTTTSTVPVPAGTTALIEVDETTTTELAFAPPKLTAVAPSKFSPVIVIAVPPAVGPDVGEIDVTAGGGLLTVMDLVGGVT